MHQVSVVGILQGGCQLQHQLHHSSQGNSAPFGIAISQGSSSHIFHHQVWQILLTKAKVEQRDNMRMVQAYRACFIEERFEILTLREGSLEKLDRHLAVRAEMLLYMASRAQLVEEVIEPALGRGAVVISDRYLLANIVYQGHAGGLGVERVSAVGLEATGGRLPDLTLVLDVHTRMVAGLTLSLDPPSAAGTALAVDGGTIRSAP